MARRDHVKRFFAGGADMAPAKRFALEMSLACRYMYTNVETETLSDTGSDEREALTEIESSLIQSYKPSLRPTVDTPPRPPAVRAPPL